MLSVENRDMLRRLNQHVPHYEKYLEAKLQAILDSLPHVNVDKVQVFQGNAIALKDLLAELRACGPDGKSQTAKPNFSTP